jgi:hypothetical protein
MNVTSSGKLYQFSHWLFGSTLAGSLTSSFDIQSNVSIVVYYVEAGIPPVIPYTQGVHTATWYMRSDTWTVHSILGYRLSETESSTMTYDNRISSIAFSSSYGVRIWLVTYDGKVSELTNGNPVAVVTRDSNGQGIQSATWNCPEYKRVISAIEVKIYQRFGTGTWFLRQIFITKSQLLITLPISQWRFYYYTQLIVGSANATLYYGSHLYNSRIDVSYIPATSFETMDVKLYYADWFGFMFTPWTYFLGDLFWGILLLFGCVTMYMRYNSIKAVLGVLWVFGGAGGILSAFIPAIGLQISWLVLGLAFALTLFKLVR